MVRRVSPRRQVCHDSSYAKGEQLEFASRAKGVVVGLSRCLPCRKGTGEDRDPTE